jgi:hypothetical protein
MPLVRDSGSRALSTLILLVTLTTGIATLAPSATAQTGGQTAAALRAEADALSSRYFAALGRVRALDDDLAHTQQLVDETLARAKQARAAARARALLAYTTSGTQLSMLVSDTDAVATARRARLIEAVNEHDQSVYRELHTAMQALRKQQRALHDTRQAQADALTKLRDQGNAVNAKLAAAEEQEQVAAAAATAAPTTAASVARSAVTEAATTTAPATTTTPSSTSTTRPPTTPTPPANYTGTPGVNPHHDDPFLTCVRLRESGGNYSAVNAAGPYLGAYQFLQATWNLTASHAGRAGLVGVPANTATPYDQDDMAWTLYQWQGMGPWGGSC